MNNATSGKNKRTLILAVVLLIIVVSAYFGYRSLQLRTATKHADQVLEILKSVIPDFGKDTGIASGQGKDPLPALIVDNKDIVGCIEIPSINLLAPVTAAGQDESGFATYVSGSPVKGHLRLAGSKRDVFRKLAKTMPGDTVAFTDVDGVRYNYRVMTQFHLKDWDEADQDLMLCYQTDDDTQFVLGCKSEQ